MGGFDVDEPLIQHLRRWHRDVVETDEHTSILMTAAWVDGLVTALEQPQWATLVQVILRGAGVPMPPTHLWLDEIPLAELLAMLERPGG